MASDLHPDWNSDNADLSARESVEKRVAVETVETKEPRESRHTVQIARTGSSSHAFTLSFFGILGAAVVIFLFIEGTNAIRASLLKEDSATVAVVEETENIPVNPSPTPSPNPIPTSPTINLGQQSATPQAAVARWPLRTNPYHVHSGFVPTSSVATTIVMPTSQAQTQQQIHSVARPRIARHAQTGPALGALGVLSIGVGLILRRKR